MTRCFPKHTRDTTALEAVMDLEEGVGMLIDRLEAAVCSFSEEEYGTDVVKEMSPVFWLVLRFQNDIADVSKKVDALYHQTREVEAAA